MTDLLSASKKVLIHNIKMKEPIVVMNNHESDYVNWCAWSPDGLIAATWGDDGRICLNNAKTGKRSLEFANEKYPFLCVAFSKTNEYLASGSEGGQIQVFNLHRRSMEYEICEDINEHITAVAWKNDSKTLIAASNMGILYVIDHKKQRIAKTMQYDSQAIRWINFSFFQHHLIATGGDNGIVTVWDIKNYEIYHTFDSSSHSDVWTGIIFSPTNELLLCSAGLDAKIQFFDIVSK